MVINFFLFLSKLIFFTLYVSISHSIFLPMLMKTRRMLCLLFSFISVYNIYNHNDKKIEREKNKTKQKIIIKMESFTLWICLFSFTDYDYTKINKISYSIGWLYKSSHTQQKKKQIFCYVFNELSNLFQD